ncbi:TonB-dependent receptor [Hirschia maritima]|uniref:TonB-dependent receptor n=1 Tax=Hirschia maritima TaxID=1121961 RepID=UPI0003749F4E|nr:TonB-dependent siderophore receptor [Hirschia maritima]
MKKAALYASAALAASAISTGVSHADDVAPLKQETTVVTSQYLYADQVNSLKAPTPIIDVPQSLSIVDAEQINLRGFNSVEDIINYTPGVNSSQGEGHRDAVVFRGVRSTADFYLDGVRDDVQYYRPLYNLEQVEILRGPNALLFGRGGTGGVLNRVTKKAKVGEEFTGYKAGIDSFGGYEGSIDSNFIINDQAAFRVNAYYEHLKNDRDFFDGDNFGINPTARINIGDSTVWDLSAEYLNHERFIDRGIPTGADGEPIERLKDIVFGDPELNTTTLDAYILRTSLQHTFSDNLKGNFTVSYGDYDKLYRNFYAANYTASDDDFGGAETVDLDGYVDTTQRTNFVVAGNLVSEFTTGSIGHTIIGGVEYIQSENNNDRYNPVFDTTGNDRETFFIAAPLNFSNGVGVNASNEATSMAFTNLNDKTEADVEVFSLYIQDQIEINQYIDVVLGARFDSFDFSADEVNKSLYNDTNGTTVETTPRSRKDEEFSPRAGIVVKPIENLSLYASYSESFLPRSGGQFANISDLSATLDPDYFEQAEIGVKWDFIEGISFTAAYFQNEQTRADRDDINSEQLEIRGLEVEGVELQIQGNITEQFFITAGYSYLEGETDQGREIPRELPENTFSVWGAYDINEKFGLGLGATYQDESFISDLDIGTDASGHPTLPAYTRVDAMAYYDISEQFRLQLNIENLTDETYFPNAHSTHQATVGAPLNARFTISGRF